MDIEEAKEQLLKHKKEIDVKFISARYSKAIEVVLSELEKKDKIINDMAIDLEYINKEILDEYDKLPYAESKQKVIDYFTNKVEEDK